VIEVVRREVSSPGKVKVFNIEIDFNIDVFVIDFWDHAQAAMGQGASRIARREPSLRVCQFPTGDAWLQRRSALSLE
jgi:hypothetical protein